MASVRAVLFDLDGTLVNTLPELTDGINAVLVQLQVPLYAQHEVSAMIGRGVRPLIEDVLRGRNLAVTDASVQDFLNRYVAHMTQGRHESAEFFPGVLESIEALRAAGVRTAIVTNKIRVMTLDFLRHKQIEHLFDAVVCADDAEHAKPAGDMPLMACRALAVAPSEALMVGDSRNDALAARAAGIAAALVRTGYNEGVPIDVWARDNGFETVRESVREVVADVLA